MDRHLKTAILEDLDRKMVLISGPRQCGKTTFSRGLFKDSEDIRDLEQVQDLARLELLYDRLPDTVGSTLSINGLREDLEVAHGTLAKWILILDGPRLRRRQSLRKPSGGALT